MSGLIKILILAAFANGLSWIVLIPIWQYPDEQSHFAQVQNIAEGGNTSIIGPNTSLEITISEKLLDTERDVLGNNKFTYHPYYHIDYSDTKEGIYEKFIANLPSETQITMSKREATENPPLYHLMASNFYNLSGGSLFNRVIAVRIFSLLLYLGTVAISINAAKLVFKNDLFAQAVLPALVAFTPMLVFSSTGVLPDPLTILLFTIIFTIGAKIIIDRLTAPLLILLLVMLVLGTFTRQQFQLAVPIALLPVIYTLARRFSKKIILSSVSIAALACVVALIFIARCQLILTIPEIGTPNPALLFTDHFVSYLLSTLKHYYSQTLPWYWGVYKWLSLTVPHIYYQIINRVIALSLLGLAVWTFMALRNRKVNSQDVTIVFFTISILCYFSIFIIWDFYFQRTYGYPFGIQGRYFLPLVLPITAVLFFGLKTIFQSFLKKYTKILYIFLICAMLIFNDGSLSFVASSYYEFSSVEEFVVQASQYKPAIFKGYIIIAILLVAFMTQLIFFINLFRYTKTNND